MRDITRFDFSDAMLAGQRLVAGFEGTTLNDDLKYLIDTLKVGGIILFAVNLEHPDRIRALCDSAQAYAAACGLPPLFVAIDQEGGRVARLKPPFFTRFEGNPSITTDDQARHFARITASELAGIGVNMNMAPVLDVADRIADSVMAGRAFAGGPRDVARLGGVVIEEMQKNGIMAVGKHFPGIGRTTADSHIDQPWLAADPAEMEATDLVPFKAAIDRGVAGIMLSHIRYTAIDPDLPASMSAPIAKTLLREKMGYNGLVMTDDLDMGAIRNHHATDEVVRCADRAGIDMVLVCHRGPDRKKAVDAFRELLATSDTHRKQALCSVERILQAKARYPVSG
ncbi:MAG: beta-N-acetylhexosaminidase [Thermodesulfobacteriota bacterium]|nr:beta-N-acetylhexosaminidase [Thermodesulfobacteriota bacterium]